MIPGRELAGVGAMVRAGLREFYLPQVATPRLCALFPGYAFIRPPNHWRPILTAANVTGVLGIGKLGDKPNLLDESVINDIRSRERNGFIELPPPFNKEARVRVQTTTHPLFGCEGICDGMRGSDRVWVFLRFLGQLTRVSFQKADLVLA